MSGKTLLTGKGVGYRLGNRQVLSGIDLEIRSGTLVALLGANGSGKSTLMKALSGVWSLHQGEVAVAGRPLRSLARRELARRVVYLPQAHPLPLPMAVEDLVALGRYPHVGALGTYTVADREAVERAIARMDLEHLRGRDVSELSGGELQRVLFARCLAQDADVLLLDEPLTGLDVGHQLQLLSMMRELAEAGKAVVWTVHDLRLAHAAGGEAWLLHGGRLAARGPVEELLRSPELGEAFGVRLVQRERAACWDFVLAR